MKWMIASDIHGSALFCRRLLAAFDRERADRLVLLGDLLYHGPRNPLPEGYAPQETAALLNARRERLVCVRGNCDADVDQMVLEFPILSDSCLLCADGRTVFTTHGHLWNTQKRPPLCPGDVLLHGHTHVPAWEPFGEENYYLNPGSVSLPKEDSPRGYLMLEDRAFTWKTLEGEPYHVLAL